MLDLTDPSATDPGRALPREGRRDARDLDDVADAGRRAVALDERALGGRQAGVAPAALDGELLADGLGAVMPLPLPSLAPATPRTTA